MKCRPIIAILRGIKPIEAESVSEILIDSGIKIIEVPLNSPSPIETLNRMVDFHGDAGIFGAGTVLNIEQVEQVHATGAKLIVSPNTNVDVIKKTKQLGMISKIFSCISNGFFWFSSNICNFTLRHHVIRSWWN